jgi:predicted nucleotidyltransferase
MGLDFERSLAFGEIANANEQNLSYAKIISDRILHLMGNKLQKVILFGSRARGDFNNDSDFDILIIADFQESSWPKRAIQISKSVRAEQEFRIPVDYVPVTEWEFENKFLLKNSVNREGIILYEVFVEKHLVHSTSEND